MMELRKVVFLSFKSYLHLLCTCVLAGLVVYIMSGKEVVHSETIMQPKVLSTSLKEKGNSYKFTFEKGSSSATSRSIVMPLKVIKNGLVNVTSNKTKVSIGIYQEADCVHPVTVTSPGTYYVNVTQQAYMIDLTDHSLAKFKKATITLKVSQISSDDRRLKDKTYTIISGTPKCSFDVATGYITLRSDYVKKSKYVKGGTYKLYENHKLVKSVEGNGEVALSKGSYVLVPDGQNAYRFKYTYHKMNVKNTTVKKATKIKAGKTTKAACFGGQARFYKIVLKGKTSVSLKLEKAMDLDLFSIDDEGDKHDYKMNESQSGDDVTHQVTLSSNTYYIKVKPKKSVDLFYHLTFKS